MSSLPNALKSTNALQKKLQGERPALFLDFDGTLTPIVARPELAKISFEMKSVLHGLAKYIPIGIISGRSREDLTKHIQIPDIYYGGCHGMDLVGPEIAWRPPEITPYLSQIKTMRDAIQEKIRDIPKALLEYKVYSLALHFRQVETDQIAQLEKIVDEQLTQRKDFKKMTGKMVFEIMPSLPWDKGTALRRMQQAMLKKTGPTLPLFLGDDTTDESAFREIQIDGIGIRIGDKETKTAASYHLTDVGEVLEFLGELDQWVHSSKFPDRFS